MCRNCSLTEQNCRDVCEKAVTCALRVYKTTLEDTSVDDVVRWFNFNIPPEVVAAYFYVPPPPPQPSVPKVPKTGASAISALLHGASQPEPEVPPATPTPTSALREPRDVAETTSRLTQSTRPRAFGKSQIPLRYLVCDLVAASELDSTNCSSLQVCDLDSVMECGLNSATTASCIIAAEARSDDLR